MRCTVCESKKKLEPKIQNVKYDASGLDNIVICGAKVYHCDNCGERYLQYGNIDEIDAAIADTLLKKDKPLSGKEIRFLRTWKGYSGQQFAKLLNSSPAHLYRIEAEDSSANDKFDRLVRLAIMSLATDRNYEIRDMLEGKTEPVKYSRMELKAKGGRYRVQYA
jgi:putative zinc finger/helix-turn-helix YgiT family protein